MNMKRRIFIGMIAAAMIVPVLYAKEANVQPDILFIMVERLADRPEGFSVDGKLVPGRRYKPLNEGLLDSNDKKGAVR